MINKFWFTLIIGLITGWLLAFFNKISLYLLSKIIVFRHMTSYSGVYDCHYHIPWKSEGENIIHERILLIRIFAFYYGFLINNPDDRKYRKVLKPQLRVCGEIFEGTYLIGWWLHPSPKDRQHGAFNLILDDSGILHEGIWTGRSHTYNKILSGRWAWKINEQFKYNYLTLLKQRTFGCEE